MADSFTPNLNLRKPEVAGAIDSWGGVAGLNGDLDLLDAVFLATGLGTSVGIHVGTGKVLNVEGQLLQKDTTDLTKVGIFSMDLVPTATTVDLKFPPAGGTIATKEILVATVQASHPVGTILSGYYGATPPSGYVFADGLTIGDATSLATNRANADCERLFLHFWSLGTPVTGGRGATAAADWAAHKQLFLPDHSGRVMAGRDDLSGTNRNVLTPGFGSQATVRAGTGGSSIDPGQTITGSITGNTTGQLNVSVGGNTGSNSSAFNMGSGGGSASNVPVDGHTHGIAISGSTNPGEQLGISATLNGAGTASFNNAQPTIIVDVIIAL